VLFFFILTHALSLKDVGDGMKNHHIVYKELKTHDPRLPADGFPNSNGCFFENPTLIVLSAPGQR